MDYRVIMAGEYLIEKLPKEKYIYNKVKKLLNDGISISISDYVTEKYIYDASILHTQTEFEFEGSNILEIGTGWHVAEPCFYYLLGADEIHTLDHIQWVRKDALKRTIEEFEAVLPKIASYFNISLNSIQNRYESIRVSGTIREMLASMNTTYHIGNLSEKNDIRNKFDLFFSRSTLQRIPENLLSGVIEQAESMLEDGGVSYHIIDCKDYHSIYDKTLNPFAYLEYSDMIWRVLTGEKLSSQNRLRHIDFLRIFEQAGFKNIYEECLRFDIELVEELNLAKRFTSYSKDEIAIGRFRLCSQVPESDSEQGTEMISETRILKG